MLWSRHQWPWEHHFPRLCTNFQDRSHNTSTPWYQVSVITHPQSHCIPGVYPCPQRTSCKQPVLHYEKIVKSIIINVIISIIAILIIRSRRMMRVLIMFMIYLKAAHEFIPASEASRAAGGKQSVLHDHCLTGPVRGKGVTGKVKGSAWFSSKSQPLLKLKVHRNAGCGVGCSPSNSGSLSWCCDFRGGRRSHGL